MGKYSKLLHDRENSSKNVVFLFIDGKYSGGEFSCPENGSIKIGRDITSDVALIDTKVSRHHAIIWNDGDKTYIKDMGSTNGTFIKGELIIPNNDTVVTPSDKITIGDSIFQYKIEEEADNTQWHELPDILLEDDIEMESSTKVNVARIKLEKQKILEKHKVSLKEGSLLKNKPFPLINKLLESAVKGTLKLTITTPFKGKFKLILTGNDINSCKYLEQPDFSDSKAYSRLLLATNGDYKLQESGGQYNSDSDEKINEITTSILAQHYDLDKTRKIAHENSLKLRLPLKTKLSSLSSEKLDSLQTMIESENLMTYLDMFPEINDFDIINIVISFIDSGLLEGEMNENKTGELLPEDIIDI